MFGFKFPKYCFFCGKKDIKYGKLNESVQTGHFPNRKILAGNVIVTEEI